MKRIAMESSVSRPGSFFAILLILCIISSCTKDEFPQYEDIHELVTETVSREHIPGMIAAIVDSSGILQIESAGVRKMGSSETITHEDHFHLGSCGKAMTSALMATLIAENKLQWETTFIEVFPELKDTIQPEYEHITLHQLLTHRAGIESNPPDQLALHDNPDIKERRYLYMKDILKEASSINAGDFNYSNLGYFIAGTMAERITGKSWEELMVESIFEPLGMNSAGFGHPGTTGLVDQPWGHSKVDKIWQPSQTDNPEEIGPAGTVHCSVGDWVRFLTLFLKQDDTVILKRRQIEKLTEPVGDYACGWLVEQRDWTNGNALFHNGSNGMWFVAVWVAPEVNRIFIVGTNSHDDHTTKIFEDAMRSLISLDRNN
jgi:CubicO group peptidase (beta-lactamase class C family)